MNVFFYFSVFKRKLLKESILQNIGLAFKQKCLLYNETLFIVCDFHIQFFS